MAHKLKTAHFQSIVTNVKITVKFKRQEKFEDLNFLVRDVLLCG